MTNASEVLADINSGVYQPFVPGGTIGPTLPGMINVRVPKEIYDPVNPSHYKDGWSDDAELISITENLNSNGGQAVQYVARSTRLDTTKNKSQLETGRIEDLEKALFFITREIKRLKASTKGPK